MTNTTHFFKIETYSSHRDNFQIVSIASGQKTVTRFKESSQKWRGLASLRERGVEEQAKELLAGKPPCRPPGKKSD